MVGSPVDSDAVRALAAADGLTASTDPDLEPPRSYLSGPTAGYELMHQSGRVDTVFLYAEPADGFAAFPGPLPGGLHRKASRTEVLDRFGTPERSGEAATIAGLGRKGAWDRFALNGVCVHFQYTEPDELVQLVSIMAKDVAP